MNESITNRYNKASEEFNQAFRANDKEKADSLKKIVFNLRQERIDFGADYVNDNPDNIFSAFLLKGFIAGLPKSKIKLLYDNLSPLVKESASAISVASYLEYSNNVNVGDMAEDFELFDVKGNKVEFKNFKDKYVLLDFWAAACASCRIENKKLLTYYQRYKNKGLEIISISSDINPKEWKSASKEDSIVWTSLHDSKDENGHVGLRYNVRIIPSGFLIEPGGRIIAKDLRGEMLEVKLKEIFKE